MAQGYKKLVLGFIVWGNIPWVVMGLSFLDGGVTSIEEFLRPREGNLWVLGWYLLVVFLWGLELWWLFFRDGAKALVDHPGLFNIPLSKPSHVKILSCVGVLAGIVAMVIAFGHDMLVPYWTNQHGDYTTVFVVYDGFVRVFGLMAVFLGIGIVLFVCAVVGIRRLNLPKWWSREKGTQFGALLLFSVLWMVVAGAGFFVNMYQSFELVAAYRDGTAQVVEGPVHVLREQPASGHAAGDLIEIKGTKLLIDYFTVTPAYKQTIAYGGALREGTVARVWHYDGKILRVDLR